MKTIRTMTIIACAVALLTAGAAWAADPSAPRLATPLAYPPARTVDQVDDYHGVKVADPYRWLEDVDAPDARSWIEAENALTFGWLAEVPQRDAIRARLEELWNYERYGIPFREGGWYFYTRNDGLQNQSVLYSAASLDAAPAVLFDPNTLRADGTMALAGYQPSEDGALLAYGLSEAGSDWNEWKVRDVATARDLSDHLKWIKFSGVSWTKDGRGFFYSRFDEPDSAALLTGENYFEKLCYHAIGTPQSADLLVYERLDEKEWGFEGEVTEDGRYLIIHVSQGTAEENRIYYKDLSRPDAEVVKLLDDFDASYGFLGNEGGVFYFQTDLAAPRGRIIAIDTARPERGAWKEIVPEGPDALEQAGIVGGRIVARYLRDARAAVRIHEMNGAVVRDVQLPGIGSVRGFGGRQDDPETFYTFAGFTTPAAVYRYDVRTGETSLFRAPQVKFDPGAYESKQVFYTSKDGTRIPMVVSHRKGIALDGDNPVLLDGYGGFNYSFTPYFSPANAVWMEMGGVYAVANIRGGGEYGKEWHEAGMKDRKQNVFDDFIAAGEWLVANGYTRPARLAITGASNGGLLVGACLLQRPDLFGATLPGVGVMDMLRFNKFTIGWAWTSDYGSPEDPKEFPALRAYSPLHNIRKGVSYPATLITTGDHDDRVVPMHSFKFAAALQAAQAGPAPVLIRIETRAGHGGGKPTAMRIDEYADQYAFLVRTLGMQPALPAPSGR
jgi:prolyl oligopeptidase